MSLNTWWKCRNGWAKAVTILSMLLILQIGLCFSTPTMVQPVYMAIVGHDTENEMGLGLVVWQALLCIATFVVVLVFAVVAATRSSVPSQKHSGDDSHD